MKKIMTTVYLDPEQVEALKKISAESKIPMAEYVREGVDRVIQAARENNLVWSK